MIINGRQAKTNVISYKSSIVVLIYLYICVSLIAEGNQELSRMKLKLQDSLASKTLSDELNTTLQVHRDLFSLLFVVAIVLKSSYAAYFVGKHTGLYCLRIRLFLVLLLMLGYVICVRFCCFYASCLAHYLALI